MRSHAIPLYLLQIPTMIFKMVILLGCLEDGYDLNQTKNVCSVLSRLQRRKKECDVTSRVPLVTIVRTGVAQTSTNCPVNNVINQVVAAHVGSQQETSRMWAQKRGKCAMYLQ